jgi:hypothetical protein
MIELASQLHGRRFRYSLRTFLIIITLFCVWLGWNAHQVRERQRMLDKIYATLGDPTIMLGPFPAIEKPIPFVWSLFGATPRSILCVRREQFTDNEFRKIDALFPETFILIPGPGQNEWVDSRRASN